MDEIGFAGVPVEAPPSDLVGVFFDFPFDLIFSEVGGIKEDTFP